VILCRITGAAPIVHKSNNFRGVIRLFPAWLCEKRTLVPATC
jgi:hypothetical protein